MAKRYFFIATGLRGAYMPDNGYCVAVNSRKELKAIVLSEYQDIKEAGYTISKKEVASTVADIWRNLKAKTRSPYSFVVPYGFRHGSSVNKCNAISIGHATRAEYLESQDD